MKKKNPIRITLGYQLLIDLGFFSTFYGLRRGFPPLPEVHASMWEAGFD
jgi:hypothetical protein